MEWIIAPLRYTFMQTGLAAGTTYHFKARVIASDGKGLSPYSSVETQVTAKATASPAIAVTWWSPPGAMSAISPHSFAGPTGTWLCTQ